jgi:hypothetical protein
MLIREGSVMNTAARLGLVASMALLALPLRAEENVDTSTILVKKKIADTMTPEQLQAYKERIARNLASRRRAPGLPRTGEPETPGDTCPAATPESSTLPYNPPADTTVGATDDYNITGACTASSTACVGGSPPGGPVRGMTYAGTGVGPDRAYHIKTDANCDLTITMTPQTLADLALMVFQPTCQDAGSGCLCIDDTAIGGGFEQVQLTAVAGTDYFIVIDGYTQGSNPPTSGPFTLSITGTGCNLVGGGAIVGVYHTVTPCRLIDTRNPPGPFGGPALAAGVDRTFIFAGACGIPSTATAVFLNVTVVNPSATGNLRIWPTGTVVPTVSALNYNGTQTRASNGIFKLSGTGHLDMRATQGFGTVDVVVDVAGYFEE